MNIVNNEQAQFHRLCEVIGRPELKTDPRFVDRPERLAHRQELRLILEEALQAKGAREWEQLLGQAGVPAGPVLSIPDIMAHDHVRHRGLIKRFERVAPVDKDIAVPRTGFRLASGQPDVDRPPPRLGEDTEAVLGDIGCSATELEELRAQGII